MWATNYTNKGHEVDIDESIDCFGLSTAIPIQFCIAAEQIGCEAGLSNQANWVAYARDDFLNFQK